MNTTAQPTPEEAQLLTELDRLNVAPGAISAALRVLTHIPGPSDNMARIEGLLSSISARTATGSFAHGVAVNAMALNYENGARALGMAMAASPVLLSPAQARSLQAAENIWRHVEHEFGLFNSVEVATLLSRKPTRTPASQLRSEGAIVGIIRGNSYRFPGFQFDRGAVRPVMAKLITAARDNNRSDEDLVYWLTSPSSFFREEDRPVDHLHEEERVLDAALEQFEGSW